MQKSKEGFFGSGDEISAAFDKIEKSNIGTKVGGRRPIERRPIAGTTTPAESGVSTNNAPKTILAPSKDTSMELFTQFPSPSSSPSTTVATQRLAVATPRPALPRGISCTAITNSSKSANMKTPTADNINSHAHLQRIRPNIAANGKLYQVPLRGQLRPDITLTPLKMTSLPVAMLRNVKTPTEVMKSVQQKRPTMEAFYICSNCKHCNRTKGPCEMCGTPFKSDPNTFNSKDNNVQVANKNIIPKKIFYGEKNVQHNSTSNEAALQNSQPPAAKVFIASEPPPVPKSRGRVPKSKAPPEPECLIISSDEEESSKTSTPALPATPVATTATTTPVTSISMPVASGSSTPAAGNTPVTGHHGQSVVVSGHSAATPGHAVHSAAAPEHSGHPINAPGHSGHPTTASGHSGHPTTASGHLGHPTTASGHSGHPTTASGHSLHTTTGSGHSGHPTTVSGHSGHATTVSGHSGHATTVSGHSDATTVSGHSGHATTVSGHSGRATTVSGHSANMSGHLGHPATVSVHSGHSSNMSGHSGHSANVPGHSGNLSGHSGHSGNVSGRSANVSGNLGHSANMSGHSVNSVAVSGHAGHVALVPGHLGNISTITRNLSSGHLGHAISVSALPASLSGHTGTMSILPAALAGRSTPLSGHVVSLPAAQVLSVPGHSVLNSGHPNALSGQVSVLSADAASTSAVVAGLSQLNTIVIKPSNAEQKGASTATIHTHNLGTVSCITRPNMAHACNTAMNSSRLVAYSEEEGEEDDDEDEEGMGIEEEEEEMETSMEMEPEDEEEEEEEEEEEDYDERHEELGGYVHDEEMEEDMEEQEEYDEPDDDEYDEDNEMGEDDGGIPVWCRSIRIGSFKVHSATSNFLPVFLKGDGFVFNVHTVADDREKVKIKLRPTDIVHSLGHFGRALPIIFIYTNAGCGNSIRNRLRMTKREGPYFDPASEDERQTRITFLIEILSDENKVFLRHIFPGEALLREIDQKTANEILVRSTPTQPIPTKCSPEVPHPGTVAIFCPQNVQQQFTPATPPPQLPHPTPSAPVLKLLTYPPPPQTGGIAITSEDLLCLDEGEFLNDVIIDFYLKYLMNEKLSETDRLRTHVFSSYFYPRLTQKPMRHSSNAAALNQTPNAADDDHLPAVSARRHNLVKTWTRHVDIFEKDFIIIPINQNAHWFLAIICFPGLVPETSRLPPNSASGTEQKVTENVTSTNDSEAPAPPQTPNNNLQKKDQACSTEGLSNNSGNTNGNSDTTIPMSTTFPQSPMIPTEHEVAEPGVPEDPLPDSSTHPDIQSQKRKPCILVFDSLSGPTRWKIVNVLREYLDIEWKMKKGSKRAFDRSTMQGFVPKVPQQCNFSDCGLFVLHYVEAFFEKPLPYFGSPLVTLIDWFAPEEVGNKREEIKSLIGELQKRQQAVSILPVSPSKSTNMKPEKISTVIVPAQAVPTSPNTQNR